MTNYPQGNNLNAVPNALDFINNQTSLYHSSFDYTPFIQTTILAIVGIVTFLATRKYNIGIATKRATIDLIHSENSEDFLKRRLDFIRVRDNFNIEEFAGKDFLNRRYNNNLNPGELYYRRIILYMLNYYEFLSIGIKNEAYDEKIYKDWFRSSLVRDWIKLKPFIKNFRSEREFSSKELYVSYEKLVKNWAEGDELEEIKIITN